MHEDIIKRLTDALDDIREVNTYWFPLVKINGNVPVVAYNVEKIYADEKIELLEAILKACGIKQVTVVQMDHGLVYESEDMYKLLYEKDEDGYIFPWVNETYYFDETKQWMIYVSHEGTITFTGSDIVLQAQQEKLEEIKVI